MKEFFSLRYKKDRYFFLLGNLENEKSKKKKKSPIISPLNNDHSGIVTTVLTGHLFS